jgi:hypothetical protein
MAGVASPMIRRSKAEGVRFLSGLLAGGVAGATLLAVPVYLLGRMLALLPEWASLVAVVAIFAALGVADLRQRTPHVWRQVPQTLWSKLTPGWLGVVWGFDLALLFTTQKTTSLIWACVAAVVLLQPSLAVVALIAISVMSTVLVVVSTIASGAFDRTTVGWSGKWVWRIRRGSGLMILAAAAVVAVHGLTR